MEQIRPVNNPQSCSVLTVNKCEVSSIWKIAQFESCLPARSSADLDTHPHGGIAQYVTEVDGGLLVRRTHLIVAALVLMPCGCASWIARSGNDISYLQNREQVRHRFGDPDWFGVYDGRTYEEYITRDKISEERRASAIGMDVAMTYGAAELIALPVELYRQGERIVLGKIVRFEYDPEGRVIETYVNGFPVQDRAPVGSFGPIEGAGQQNQTIIPIPEPREFSEQAPERREFSRQEEGWPAPPPAVEPTNSR